MSATTMVKMFSLVTNASLGLRLGRRFLPKGNDRARHEDRGVGADQDPHQQREGEVVDHLAAEGEERAGRHEGSERGDDGAGEDLVDAPVEDGRHRVLQALVQVLPDPVEDDDGVGERVAGDGEDRGDQEEVHLLVEHEEDREDRQDVVQGRHHGAYPELVVEAPGDVDDDAEHGDGDRNQGVAFELVPDGGADLGGALDHERVVREILLEDPLDGVGELAGALAHLDQELVPLLDLLEVDFLDPLAVKRLARGLGGHRLVEAQLHGGAAGKVDTHVGRAAGDGDDADDTDDGDDPGDDEGDLAHTDEVYVGLAYQFHCLPPYMLSRLTWTRSRNMSKSTFVARSDVNRLMMIPRLRETANPLTGPVPNWKSTAAVISVVTCESMMVRNALS
jgi:hypothetical protein